MTFCKTPIRLTLACTRKVRYITWMSAANGRWVSYRPRRVLLDCERPQAFRKTRAADVIAFAVSRQAEFSELARMFSLWLILMDPPEHTRLRKLLNKGFSPAAIEALRPQVEAIVDRMLSPLQPGSEVELMGEFANPMPVRIISEMLGVPQELHDTFVNWSRAIAVFRGSPVALWNRHKRRKML